MTLYIDLVMFLNFLVDYLLLLSTNHLAGCGSSHGRLLLAAALGSLYSGLCLLPRLFFLGSPLWYLTFLLLISLLAFGISESSFRRGALFLILSLALGGMATAIRQARMEILLLEALALWLLTRISFGGRTVGTQLIPISISQGETVLHFSALRDTGNQLRDPVTGESVIVVAPKIAKQLLDLSPSQLAAPLETLMSMPKKGLRLIPYSAVGTKEGMLLGRRFSSVSVGTHTGSALLAFAPEGLGPTYDALTGGSLC